MQLSDFGEKMSGDAGILQLMDDLGKALADHPPLAMFGGGNPAQIPAVTEVFKKSLHELLANESKAAAMLGNYDTPQGNAAFITTIKDFLNRHYDLGITEANIAVTPGSQTGYFMLFNLLAGKSGSLQKKILFPLVPEYIGYVDQALEPDSFASQRPQIENVGEHEFKYRVDFGELKLDETIAGICVSRPTNPTGNVVTDEELEHLGKLAVEHGIPLIIDNAYGLPFPGVVVPDVKPFWNDHTVLSISLSKVGLPSSRVGVFVGPAELMQALTSTNAIVSLANPGFGQYVARPLIESDEILHLSEQHIKPYYFDRAAKARKLMNEQFPADLPWRLHVYEGSYFFWLWLPGSKMTSKALYAYLKERSVLVVPGEHFFPGQDVTSWPHGHECLRLNFARPDTELEAGIPILAEAIRKAYE
jgi:valine--pyruvate aminotransferase